MEAAGYLSPTLVRFSYPDRSTGSELVGVLPVALSVKAEPLEEHFLLQVLGIAGVAEIVALFEHLDWLEGLLVPLLEADAHLVLTKAVEDPNKVLESCVALAVEAAVGEELVHSVLLTGGYHGFEVLEHDFGDK